MQKLLFAFLFALSFLACKDDDCSAQMHETPECIQEKIDLDLASPSPTLIAVYWVPSIEGGDYWFHDGSTAWDGEEFILSAQCDTVCAFCGECDPPACLDIFPEYGSSDWQLVWEP